MFCPDPLPISPYYVKKRKKEIYTKIGGYKSNLVSSHKNA
jgi:hypothetical protein